MSVFKCKMCGGTIEFEQGATVGVCDSCGTKQTLPRLDDDRKANLYDRANHFRRSNDFDKAMGIYEQILNEDSTDAEAYWSLVLCRYGIEYVEDPVTHNRIPTVNRAQFTSIFADEDYKSALHYADARQRELYEQEAQAIDEIQKGILEISSKEEPFDVFICYKETDTNGRRTQDSVLANDLYHQLTQEGFKVFFARITLEDKLGAAYEPYIFAALNSAKVMVVLGTKQEYFNAVWVKNEWSRYLALVKQSNGKKALIPAYRDMDPYDLPEEFSHLQAQDMSKLGFMQDLIRGIKKIVSGGERKAAKETVVTVGAGASIAPLLERVAMFLEDGSWDEANQYCEKVLDQDPKNAHAYLGKLMAELRVRNEEELKTQTRSFRENGNLQKVMRFADAALKAKMTECLASVDKCVELARKEKLYSDAMDAKALASNEEGFSAIAQELRKIPGYKDADEQAEQCELRAEECHKNVIYQAAVAQMCGKTVPAQEAAASQFEQIVGWKDADEKLALCRQTIAELEAEEERQRLEALREEKWRKIIKWVALGCLGAIVAALVWLYVLKSPMKYRRAVKLEEAGEYDAAIELFVDLRDYRDSRNRTLSCYQGKHYQEAVDIMESGDYALARDAFETLGDYKDSAQQRKICDAAAKEEAYQNALAMLEEGKKTKAVELLKSLGDYKDSSELAASIFAQDIKAAQEGDYVTLGAFEQDDDESNGKEPIEWQVLAQEEDKVLLISRYVLDYRENNSWDDLGKDTWPGSSLRRWLNETFLFEAFSEEEQALIQVTTVPAENDPKYAVQTEWWAPYPDGEDTEDKLFIFSYSELNKYFAEDWGKAPLTAYADHRINEVYGMEETVARTGEEYCDWWVRLPGNSPGGTATTDGQDGGAGIGIYSGVRPAMWVDVSAVSNEG